MVLGRTQNRCKTTDSADPADLDLAKFGTLELLEDSTASASCNATSMQAEAKPAREGAQKQAGTTGSMKFQSVGIILF